MKVLAINGSPRKEGNTDLLCQEFLKGSKESGHETEQINLVELNMSFFGTKKNPEEKTEEAIQKLLEADVIVLATPVYFYSMSALMKNFIDRTVGCYTKITGKKFYYIICSWDPKHENMEKTIAGLDGFLECLDDAILVKTIYGTGAYNKGDVLRMDVIKEAYEEGKKIQ